MAAILFNSLHPHLCSNPCFLQFHPNTSLFSYTNISSSLSPNPPKNPKPNHPPNPLPLPSTANNSNVSVSIGSISPSADAVIKVPTAPWMKGPLLLQSDEVIDLSKSNAKKSFRKGKLGNSDDKELIEKESGVRGKKAMNKIVESIEKLQKTKNSNVPQKKSTEFQFGDYMERNEEKEDLRTRGKMPWEKDDRIVFRRTKKEKVISAAELTLDKALLERLRNEAARMRKWVKVKKAGVTQVVVDEIKVIWKRNELAMVKFDVPLCRNMDRAQEILEIKTGGLVVWSKKDTLVVYRGCNYQLNPRTSPRTSPGSISIQKIPIYKLNRVELGIIDCSKVKSNENIMHKLLSEKHGHRESVATGTHCKEFQNCQPVSGSLYEREANRLWDQKTSPNAIPSSIFSKKIPLHEGNIDLSQVNSHENIMDKLLSEKHGGGESVATGTQCKEIQNCQPVSGSLYEREADRLLDGLGPRFIDWWMHKPLPVDADLLPEVITGFRPPFRLCPPRARAKMTDNKLTHLRKLAQSLPTHFVLGRNRKLQGLAAAILKLWEKSLIAKIAVKYGIPNTNNEEMANELKWLTGGVLLLRNKYFIILYRGNDFLPNWVANLIKEREMELKSFQLEEEGARIGAVEAFPAVDESLKDSTTSGTLSEFQNIQKEFGYVKNTSVEVEVRLEAEKETLERELRKQEHKAFILKKKIEKSARELSKLSTSWMPADQDGDLEILTKEERECFRKIGLKMDCCLVLGRRGVFDGVMEGLFQHWKHREVLKVITMQRVFRQVIYTAKLLEAESGGILVSVDKIKEGHAIIIFRGKNYRRSSKPIAKSLLNKKEALQRSLEMQRIGSLKFFAYQRQQMISGLKLKLTNLKREIDHIEIEKQ